MGERKLERWSALHGRFCRQEPVTAQDEAEYAALCREMDEEEMAQLQVSGLRKELDRFEALEKKHARLMEEKLRLDAEINSRLSSLSDRSKRRLKVGM